MDLQDYLEPIEVFASEGNLPEGLSIKDYIRPHDQSEVDYDVAIIGVANDTNGTNNPGSAEGIDLIRKELYKLRGNFNNIYLADLGNVKNKTVKDGYFALEEVVSYLISNKVIPIIIGATNDYVVPLFKGIKEVRKKVNLICVDQTLDANNDEDFYHQNFLKDIFNDPGLLSFSLLAYQSYLYDDTILKTYENFPVNTVRLGQMRKLIHTTEPLFRDCDLAAFDMGAVRLSDAPGVKYGSPNGLFGEELCQLARYAGFSDRIGVFSIFETNPQCDINNQTAKLAAQAIWHFLDGLDKRYKDFPVRDITSYKKYVVQQSDIDHELVFYQNPLNNRWWLVVDADQNLIVSCSVDDYQYASSNKIPDIYYKWSKHIR